MVIKGDYNQLTNALDNIKLFLLNQKTESMTVSISVSIDNKNMILADKQSLEILDAIWGKVPDDCFFVDETVYHAFMGALHANETNTFTNIKKTDDKKQKTNDEIEKTGKEIEKTHISLPDDVSEKDIKKGATKGKSNREQKNDVAWNDLYIIENHEKDCVDPNRPAAFAIKKQSEDKFLLFYRRSVYDQGIDTNFRNYLNNQSGILVAYIYFKNIESLRAEYRTLGLSLRHNGKNELTIDQCNNLLKDFSSLRFL